MAVDGVENNAAGADTSTQNGAANGAVANGGAVVGAPARAVPSADERARKRAAALKFTDDGRPATLAELGDERRELSKNERIKLEKPGPKVWDDVVERYAKEGFSAIEEDDFERFKWIGFYQQRPKDGHFMMRIKLPGGWVTNEQLRVISRMAGDYARGIADISTRQAFQMHWLTVDQFPDIMDRLETVDLGVKKGYFGACGDICRNIVSNPLTGLDAEDVLDPTDFVWEASQYFSSHPDYADLPRKYKVGIFGHRSSGQVEINCMSFYGVKRSDGRVGYGVTVGGGLSTEPFIAQDLDVWVAPEQALATMEAITRLYRDHGYRKNRKHARLKYLMADWGAEKMRNGIEEILGYKLEDAEEQPKVKGYEDKLGVFPQKQDGLSFIGVPVVGGRLRTEQLDVIADLAQQYGSGDIRLTVMQNFYIPNIKNEDVEAVTTRLAEIGLPVEVSAIKRGIVACTGIEFCNLAVTETKQRAGNIVQMLDQGVKWEDSEFFRINVNGCPNSCGQHWLADVGLQGCTKKVDGELKEHFDVFLGGALGTNHQSGGARYNRRIKRLMAEEVAPAIQAMIGAYKAKKQDGESFTDFVARHSDEELAEMF
jgi:ferredoxin-nitrite reductase